MNENKMIQELDYSALKLPVSATQVRVFKALTGKFWIPTSYFPAGALAAVAFILFIFGFLGESMNLLFMIFGFLALAGAIFFAGLFLKLKKNVRLYNFASTNNATYRHDINYTDKGVIFHEGDSQCLVDSLTFANGIEVARFQYKTGSGRSRSTHTWGYARIPLHRKMPHMVLDGKKNNLFGRLSNLPDGFSASQKLSLEGDFDTYFTLYAPQEYARDALYIFTPDVMQACIKEGGKYDMEIIDDALYVYSQSKYDIADEATIRSWLAIANTIGVELKEQGKRYSDEKVASPALNVVAAPGQRLKTTASVSMIISAVVFLIYIILTVFYTTSW